MEDNGSLAFLSIPKDETNVQFHCEQTRQSKLVNTTFWIRDVLDDVKTKHSDSKNLLYKLTKNRWKN